MDGAYLRFMMCQCLLNRADWGLAIGCTNCVLSFCLFQFWLVEFFKSMENYPAKWVVLYGCYAMFNVITMMRIVKRESISVFYWICGTVAVLIFRIHYLYVEVDDFWLAKRCIYRISNIVADVYIFVSLLVMIYVMWGLHLESGSHRLYPKEEKVNNYKYDREAESKTKQKKQDNAMEDYEKQEKKARSYAYSPEKDPEDTYMEEDQKQLDNDLKMEELNERANQKLASILEQVESFQDREVVAPTAPEEYASLEIYEASAPPESNYSFEIDFNDQIVDISYEE
ncbi:hypothetical protein KR074_003333 [Drosophila pseudoananassae]|nr:hypothetical protein KR074_003333 [Drosophila pseudoananassae]